MKLYNIMWLMIFINIGIILVTTLGIWNVFEGLTLYDFIYSSLRTTALNASIATIAVVAGTKVIGIDVTDAAVYGAFIILTVAVFNATSSVFVTLASYIGAASYVNLILIMISFLMPFIAIIQMKTGGFENFK